MLSRGTSKLRRRLGRVLWADGPGPELVNAVQALQDQARSESGRLAALVARVDALTADATSLRENQEKLTLAQAAPPPPAEIVAGLLERVHAHEMELRDLRHELERFGGSALDDMAVERRLQNIEGRLSSAQGVGSSGRDGSRAGG